MTTQEREARELKFDVGEVLTTIYDLEIPIRLEWVYDGGYTWSLIDGQQWPRLWRDDANDGGEMIMENAEGTLHRLSPLPEVDWIERGSAYNIHEAIEQLVGAIVKRYPKTAEDFPWLTK